MKMLNTGLTRLKRENDYFIKNVTTIYMKVKKFWRIKSSTYIKKLQEQTLWILLKHVTVKTGKQE